MRAERLAQALFGPGAEARDLAQPATLQCSREIGGAVNAQLLPERVNALRTEPRDVQQRRGSPWHRAAQFLQQSARAGPGDLVDLRVEVRTDAEQLSQRLAARGARREVGALL